MALYLGLYVRAHLRDESTVQGRVSAVECGRMWFSNPLPVGKNFVSLSDVTSVDKCPWG